MDKTQKSKSDLKQTREFQIKLDRLQLESKCNPPNFASVVSFLRFFFSKWKFYNLLGLRSLY